MNQDHDEGVKNILYPENNFLYCLRIFETLVSDFFLQNFESTEIDGF